VRFTTRYNAKMEKSNGFELKKLKFTRFEKSARSAEA